jgi:hypothetical protein
MVVGGLVLSEWLVRLRASNATRRKVRSAAAYSFIVLPLFARLEALNRRLASRRNARSIPSSVVDFETLLARDLA